MRLAGLAALACAFAIAACGGGDDSQTTVDLGLSDPELQHLTCADWVEADEATRDEIVRRLTEVLGGQVTGRGAAGSGSVLSDEQASSLFDRQCEPEFARAFVLYKLYGLASGFEGGAP